MTTVNYLAHFQLAGSQEGLILGALLGDFVKGPIDQNTFQHKPQYQHLPKYTLEGIQLHRRIDGYFDQQHRNLLSRKTVEPVQPQFKANNFRRYLPIVLDLLFDFFLTQHWHEHAEQSLDSFERMVLEVINLHQRQLPKPAFRLSSRLKEHQLLSRYGDLDLLRDICASIAKRLPAGNTLCEVFDEACEQESLFKNYFRETYPLMVQFSNDCKHTLLP